VWKRQLIKSLPSVKSIKARVGDPKVAEHSAYSKSSNSTVDGTSSGFHNTCLTNQILEVENYQRDTILFEQSIN
jgi:hypothetical protein